MNNTSKPRTRVARWTGALLLGFFVLVGCSKLRFALGLAPWYAERQITSQLPKLKPFQQQLLKAEIQRYWSWNKHHLMPAYGSALRTLAAGLSSTAKSDPKDLALTSALITGLYDQSVEPMLKPAATLLYSFDAEQIDEQEAFFRKKQVEHRTLYLSDPKQTFERRVDKLCSTLGDWAGKLSPEQRRQIEELSRHFVIPYQAWLNDQARREAELIHALRERRSEAFIQSLLHDWWMRARTGGEDRESWQWDEAALEEHVQGIIGVLTPEQKAQASRKLVELAEELEALAVEPVAQPKPTAGK